MSEVIARGTSRGRPLDLRGHVFGRLTVCESTRKGKAVAWICSCTCGATHTVTTTLLTQGLTRSCGCLQKELRHRGPNTRHRHTVGAKRSPEHSSWSGMLERCLNPNNKLYPQYGGRGISICERWMTFENFFEDMGHRPKGTTIDRYPNNDGHYEPGNCRWATAKEQARNTRATLFVEFNGRRTPLREVAEITGVKYMTLYQRLTNGWTLDRAVQMKDGRDWRKVDVDMVTVRKMRAEGASMRVIAEHLGVSQTIIFYRLKEAA